MKEIRTKASNRNKTDWHDVWLAGKKVSRNKSVVSDVFDGRILSSVQCLTCERVSCCCLYLTHIFTVTRLEAISLHHIWLLSKSWLYAVDIDILFRVIIYWYAKETCRCTVFVLAGVINKRPYRTCHCTVSVLVGVVNKRDLPGPVTVLCLYL